MNTTATLTDAWSRRCSTETVFSIQGKETDIARDTSDTDAASDIGDNVEYEPVTEDEHDGPVDGDTSGQSDNDIITTKVIEVSAGDDLDLEFADSEQTATESQDSDSEVDLHDYWHCAQCRAANNNPLYRYCYDCYKVRKNFFPPRPKRKRKMVATFDSIQAVPRTLSQDSGVDTLSNWSQETEPHNPGEGTSHPTTTLGMSRKRRADSHDIETKRQRLSQTDTDTDDEVTPLVKTVSAPSITLDKIDPLHISKKVLDKIDPLQISKKVIANSLKSLDSKDLCVICVSEPKSGVFVHGRIAHICCCYRCAVKVWAKAKRCPVCNCRVSNVLKAVVM